MRVLVGHEMHQARKRRDLQIQSQSDAVEAEAAALARLLQRIFAALAADIAAKEARVIKAKADPRLMEQAKRIIAQQTLEMFGRSAGKAGSNLGTLAPQSGVLTTAAGEGLLRRIETLGAQLQASVEQTSQRVLARVLEERGSKSPREIAREYSTQIGQEMSFDRALTWARTEAAVATTSGTVAAYEAAGVQEIEWMAFKFPVWSRRHDKMDGVRVAVGESFTLPSGVKLRWPCDPLGPVGEVVNCFLPDVRIAGPLVAGLRSRFDGEIVRIQTAGGWTAVTPNHPIPTGRGWLTAKEIRQGDHLIRHRFQVDPIATDHDDQKHGPTAAEVFEKLAGIGASMRFDASALDLHGDATANQEIEIVSVDRELLLDIQAAVSQRRSHLTFELAHQPTPGLGPSSHLDVGGSGPPARLPGATSLPLDSLTALALDSNPLQPLSLGATTTADTVLFEAVGDYASRNIQKIRQSLFAHPGLVANDKVLRVDVVSYSGHVYDFQSQTGLVWANGILASNCRCSVKPVRRARGRRPAPPPPPPPQAAPVVPEGVVVDPAMLAREAVGRIRPGSDGKQIMDAAVEAAAKGVSRFRQRLQTMSPELAQAVDSELRAQLRAAYLEKASTMIGLPSESKEAESNRAQVQRLSEHIASTGQDITTTMYIHPDPELRRIAEAVYTYTSGGYTQMLASERTRQSSVISDLASAPLKPTRASRGFGLAPEVADSIAPGQVLPLGDISSFSTADDVAVDFADGQRKRGKTPVVYRTTLKRGTKIRGVSAVTEEDEVLTSGWVRVLRVKRVPIRAGQTRIELDVEPADEPQSSL